MAATIKGIAVVWGIGTLGFTVAGVASGSLPQSANLDRASDHVNLRGADGAFVASIFSGFLKKLSLSVIPSGVSGGTNTIAEAKASMDRFNPKPGTTVIITDDLGAIIDDTYNVVSSKQGRTVDGAVTVDLELEGSDEGKDITTLIA